MSEYPSVQLICPLLVTHLPGSTPGNDTRQTGATSHTVSSKEQKTQACVHDSD